MEVVKAIRSLEVGTPHSPTTKHMDGLCKPIAEAVEIVWRFGVKSCRTSLPVDLAAGAVDVHVMQWMV